LHRPVHAVDDWRVADPQRDRPSISVIKRLLADKDPALQKLYLGVHALVLKTLPDVHYTIDLKDGMIGYGARQYGASGWGIAALACHSRWVSLGFLRGAELGDPSKILEGTGKKVRHVKLHSAEEFEERRRAVRALILYTRQHRHDVHDGHGACQIIRWYV
jgi:hypothetical protein